MKEIPNTRNQYRRDFIADYECENCGHKVNISGYDDYNFHVNVIPDWTCPNCNESTKSLNENLPT